VAVTLIVEKPTNRVGEGWIARSALFAPDASKSPPGKALDLLADNSSRQRTGTPRVGIELAF